VKIIQAVCDGSTAFSTVLKSSEVAGTTPDIAQLYAGGQIMW
jgi:hypothetical protein